MRGTQCNAMQHEKGNVMSERTLNDIMQFDHVIRVKNSVITEDNFPIPVFAPELMIGTDADGQILSEHERHMIQDAKRYGWDVQTGWSGQYSYSGPIMHTSEYIGGALADHIRETDGYWVVVAAECWPVNGGDETEPAGWLLLHRELNTAHVVLTTGGWPDNSKTVTHRIKDGLLTYSGPNKTGCGIVGHFSVHHRTGDNGPMIDVTCKRGGCKE